MQFDVRSIDATSINKWTVSSNIIKSLWYVIQYLLVNLTTSGYAESEQGIARAIIRSVIDFKRDPWPKISDTAKDLVKRMLDPDPKRRLTAQEVLGKSSIPKCSSISDYSESAFSA